MTTRVATPLVQRTGRELTVHASVWPRGEPADPTMVEVSDPSRPERPVVSIHVEVRDARGLRLSALVHGYGCSCAEEVELWEPAGLVLVGAGQALVALDVSTGAVRLRLPMGGYFNCLWMAEDGRDAFACGDEVVARLVPPGNVAWKRTVGVDGVMVHRAVGVNVFVSAQRRVGGPWVDFLLDRTSGSVLEAPEADDDEGSEPAKPGPPARSSGGWKGGGTDPEAGPDADADADEDGVRMVRDDETDSDDDE